jgi:hypothetical protein
MDYQLAPVLFRPLDRDAAVQRWCIYILHQYAKNFVTVGRSELNIAGESGANMAVRKKSCLMRSIEIRNQRPLSHLHLLKRCQLNSLTCHSAVGIGWNQRSATLIFSSTSSTVPHLRCMGWIPPEYLHYQFRTILYGMVIDCLDGTKMYSCDNVLQIRVSQGSSKLDCEAFSVVQCRTKSELSRFGHKIFSYVAV